MSVIEIPAAAYEAAEQRFRQMMRIGIGSHAYKKIVEAAAPALIQAGREAAARDITKYADRDDLDPVLIGGLRIAAHLALGLHQDQEPS